MSESEQLLRDDLDCLRLASDLTRLASYVPCAALKAHILQIARTCTSLVDVHQPGRSVGDVRSGRGWGLSAPALALGSLAPPPGVDLNRG